eukprot:scaffold86298_cov30-Tisochrysis_lutea.AAC.1
MQYVDVGAHQTKSSSTDARASVLHQFGAELSSFPPTNFIVVLSSGHGGGGGARVPHLPSQAPIPLRGAYRSTPCSAFGHEQGNQHNHPDPQSARVASRTRPGPLGPAL